MQPGLSSYEMALRGNATTPLDKLDQVLSVVQQLVAAGEDATCQQLINGAQPSCLNGDPHSNLRS